MGVGPPGPVLPKDIRIGLVIVNRILDPERVQERTRVPRERVAVLKADIFIERVGSVGSSLRVT